MPASRLASTFSLAFTVASALTTAAARHHLCRSRALASSAASATLWHGSQPGRRPRHRCHSASSDSDGVAVAPATPSPLPFIRKATTMATAAPMPTCLTAAQAAALDDALMSPRFAYGLPQLMELAGQAVAHAVAAVAAPGARIILAVGPGNNGGDGLVAARHLAEMRRYRVGVAAPKTKFAGLVLQAKAFGVEFAPSVAALFADGDADSDADSDAAAFVVVDSVFGFSFDGANGVRKPFDAMLADIESVMQRQQQKAILVAVDVPSGWHVEKGRIYEAATRTPDVLVSLSAPKLVAKTLPPRADGAPVIHYVGGRFVPPELADEMGIVLPGYEGTSMIALVD